MSSLSNDSPSLETVILFDMLDAFGRTLARVRSFDPDEQGDAAYFHAAHNYDVARSNLIAALKCCTPRASLEYRPGFHVSADDEGGLRFRDWDKRHFNPEAQLCSAN